MYKPVCRQCYNATLRPSSSGSQGQTTATTAAFHNQSPLEISPLKANNEETMTTSQNDTTLESGHKRKHRQKRGKLGDDSQQTLALQKQESCELENIMIDADEEGMAQSAMADDVQVPAEPSYPSAAECFKRARVEQK